MGYELPDKWLTVDPGESVGWSLWEKDKLTTAGTGELWPFGSSFHRAMFKDHLENEMMDDELAVLFAGVETIVVEDFKIYPWVAKAGGLNWDSVRTARLIGALTVTAAEAGVKFVLQGAKIKERAEAAGAKAFFLSPLDENRHANDAIRHGAYYIARSRGASEVEQASER